MRCFIRQEEENDCGYAVAAMVINYLQNENVSVDELKVNNDFTSESLSLENIETVLNKFSIEAKFYNGSLDEIMNGKKPFILYVHNENNNGHFVLLYEKRNNNFLIADPGKNDFCWIKKAELDKMFQNIFVVLTKKEVLISYNKVGAINNVLKERWISIFIILVCSILSDIVFLISSNFSKVFFNNISINNDQYVILLIMIFLLVFIASELLSFVIAFICHQLETKLKEKLFSIFVINLNNSTLDYYEKIPIEKWMVKVEAIDYILSYKIMLLINLPVNFFMFLFCLFSLVEINTAFLLLSIGQNIIISAMFIFFGSFIKSSNYKKQLIGIELSKHVNDLFYGFESVWAKNVKKEMNNKTTNYFNSSKVKSENIKFTNYFIDLTFRVVSQVFYFVICYVGYKKITSKEVEIGDLVYFFSINVYISKFSNTITSIIKSKDLIKYYFKEIAVIFNNSSSNKKITFDKQIKIMQVKNVTKIRNEENVFEPITFRFDKNTFIYGKSGAGKSTLLKILANGYEYYTGSVLINNTDIRTVDRSCLQEKIVYLGQYDYLFTDSVFENIKLFKEINLEVFQKYDFFNILNTHNISLDTKIYNNGANLSKGQRQIINFLSLFFLDREVIIIDESLSNVDTETAECLFEMLLDNKKSSLILMCSHKMSWSNYFDNKLELK